MQELLAHPAVQGGIAPFVAGLAVAAALFAARLGGLAAIAGFAAAVWLIGNFALEPLTATRKLVVVGALAAAVGLLADFAFKATRATAPVLGALFGAASLWVFWSVLAQKPLASGLLYGAGTALFVGWCVAFALSLQADPVRAGAAGLGMGLGAGICAVLGASALLGQYGLALGAASGGFLLVVMILGRRVVAGASFALPAAAIASLVAAGTLYLAQLPWYALAALALVPVAVRLPLPNAAAWLQSFVAAFYTLATAGAACALAWQASRS
jgi:hypothetical protein